MSKLQELINKLCPNGVEYRFLWEVTIWDKKFNGTTKEEQEKTNKYTHISSAELKKLEIENGDIKLLSTGNYEGYTNHKLAKNFINEGEIFTIPSGGTANIKYHNGLFVDSGNIIGQSNDSSKILTKYIYYWLINNKEKIQNLFRGSGVKHPDMVSILQFKIPVPPIEVQDEIVRILDNFTNLQAELQAELVRRIKQYEHVRNVLLTDKKNEYLQVLLEECCYIYAGGDIDKNEMKQEKTSEYKIPVISNGIGEKAIQGYTNKSKINEPAVTVSARGTIGYAEYRDYPYYPIIRLISLIPKENTKLNTKYLYYIMQNMNIYSSSTGIPQLTIPMIAKKKISLPPIHIQEKIVYVLDNFEKVCKDLNIGLPAEIKERQKQYEFYRNLLLTFPNGIETILKKERKR